MVPALSEGDYATAFRTYLTDCETYLSYYSQGKAFDKGSRLPGAPLFSPVQILIIIFVPLLIALIVCLIFKSQMKTAKKATGAGRGQSVPYRQSPVETERQANNHEFTR